MRGSFAIVLTVWLICAGCSGGDGVSSPFTIASGAAKEGGVAASWGGDRYLVTFAEELPASPHEQDVLGVRLTEDGEPIDDAPFLLSDLGADPFLSPDASYAPGGIAFANGAFGAFFFGAGTIANEGPPGQIIGFVSVPESGAPVLPAIAVDEEASFSMTPASLRPPITAATNGARYLGIYERILSMVGSFSIGLVYGQIVTPIAGGVSPELIGPFTGIGIPVEGTVTDAAAPGVAVGATVTLVAWVQDSFAVTSPFEPSTQVAGVLLTPESATWVELSDTATGSQATVVATDGEDFLVVWTAPGTTSGDDSAPPTEVRAIRVAADGSASPAGGFLVDGDPVAKSLGAIAHADGAFLVAWIEDGAVEAARLGTSGEEVEVFTIDPGPASSVALATDGDRFLAVFDRPSGASAEVLGSFVSAE